MAISFASPGGLQRNATFLDFAQDWTKCGWFQTGTPLTSGALVIYRMVGPTDLTYTDPYAGLFAEFSLNGAYVEARNAAGDDQFEAPPYGPATPNVWRHLAMRYKRSTTELSLVVNGAQVGPAATIDLSATSTPSLEYLCGFPGGSALAAALSAAYVGDWQRWLSDAELLAQVPATIPVITTNLLQWDTLDDAADLGSWSAFAASPTTVDGPLSVACGSVFCDTPPPHPPTPPSVDGGQTLIFETGSKRWLQDATDLMQVTTRLSEPGAGVYDHLVAGDDGGLYQFDLDAILDDGVDLPWYVFTRWVDADQPRIQKQFGDASLNLDAAGSIVGIVAQPVAQDGVVFPASVTLGAGDTTRQAYVIDLRNDGDLIARNFGLQLYGRLVEGDVTRPALFWWEPSFILKGDALARRATDWDDLGYVGAKFVQGVIIRANTYGENKLVQVQRATENGPETMLTLMLNHDGEAQIAYPLAAAGWDPFIGELVRLVGADGTPWQILGYRFVWEPAPELATQWETQFGADGPGYESLRDCVIAHESPAPLTLVLTYDGDDQTYVIPASGGGYKRDYIVFAPGKGRAVRFKITTPLPGRLYKRDLSVRCQTWGDTNGYRTLQPFGGPSRADGAAI